MRTYYTTLIYIAITFVFCCCSDNAKGEEPMPQPQVASQLKGSFESQYKRYAQGEKHTGQSNLAKIETEWRDTVWANDRVHKQIVLWTEQEELTNLTYNMSDLKFGSHSIASSNIRLRFPSYVLGDTKSLACGEQASRQQIYIADALSETQVTKVTQADPVKIWVTVDIPKATKQGLYEGELTVKLNGTEQLVFNIKLLVAGHTLPDPKDWTYHLDIWQFPYQLTKLCVGSGVNITPFSSEYKTMMRSFYEKLADAGQTAVTTYIKDGAFNSGQTMVQWTLNPDNSWSFDYTDFDSFVEFMFSLGIDKQINCFSLTGWSTAIGYYDAASSSNKTKKLAIGTSEYNDLWTIFLNSFRTHLREKGWFSKAVLYLDETRNEEARKIINLIQSNDPEWKIGLAGSYIDEDIERALYDYSTIYGYDRNSTNNTYTTFYTSCSQNVPNNYVTKETSPAEMVWMAWYAAAKGMNGYVRWAYDYWQSSDPVNIQDGANTAGDFNMIYRTDNKATSKVVTSIRFELLREGIQDYEKIRSLSNAQLNAAVKTVTPATATNAELIITKVQNILKKVSLN